MMRLFDVDTQQLLLHNEMGRQQNQPYVIISHVWREGEIVFRDMDNFEALKQSATGKRRTSVAKIQGACKAVKDRRRSTREAIDYLWLDTICINQKDPTELTTAINSMYRW